MDLEKISDRMHEVRAKWYKHQRDNYNVQSISRREKQSETDYEQLSEEEKEKDREIVRFIIFWKS